MRRTPSHIVIFFFIIPRPPRSTLFPYTTLFPSIPTRVVHQIQRNGRPSQLNPNLQRPRRRKSTPRYPSHTRKSSAPSSLHPNTQPHPPNPRTIRIYLRITTTILTTSPLRLPPTP